MGWRVPRGQEPVWAIAKVCLSVDSELMSAPGPVSLAVRPLRTRVHPPGIRVFWVLVQLVLCVLTGRAADSWRVFRTADRLPDALISSVTVGPRSNVWVRHGPGAESVSRLDGFGVRLFPAPGEGTYPIHESRSGQLWSLGEGGLMLLRGGRWESFDLDELRQIRLSDPLFRVRGVPIIPAEVNHVLFLLADRLMVFDAASGKTRLVHRSTDSGIGRYLDMAAASDGGVWVSGQRGLAHLPGPLRQVGPEFAWQEWPAPEDVRDLQRPMEARSGRVGLVGDRAGDGRVVVTWDHGRWSWIPAPMARVRSAWESADGRLWAMAREGLWSRPNGRWEPVERGEWFAGNYTEVALQQDGTFWVGTTEGLVLYTPPLWEPVDALAPGPAIALSTARPTGGILIAGVSGVGRVNADIGAQARDGVLMVPTPGEIRAGPRAMVAVQNVPWVAVQGVEGLWWLDSLQPSSWVGGPKFPTGTEPLSVLGTLGEDGLSVLVRDGEGIGILRVDGSGVRPFLRPDPVWGRAEDWTGLVDLGPEGLWLTGAPGCVRFLGSAATVFTRRQGYTPSRWARVIPRDGGRVWVAGGDLVQEFDGRSWTEVRSRFERIHSAIQSRDGAVWIAAASGLHRFREGVWMHHGVEEGLPSAVVYDVLEDSLGRIWAGTARGVARYREWSDLDPPRTTIRRDVQPGNSEDVESFTWSGQDRWKVTPTHRLLYASRLDQGPWSPVSGEVSRRFQRLSAGVHRFEVRAMDRNWNLERLPAELEFEVVLPWHRDPRLLGILLAGLVLTVFLAGVAVNRHLRLLRSHAEVERIVTQRTAELERVNRELLHSQKMKALGTLAAGVAHDFNNILSVIKGSAQVIERNLEDPDKIQLRLERIRTVVEQGTAVVRSMLGLARAESVSRRRLAVSELLEAAAQTGRDSVPPEVSIEVRIPPGLPEIEIAADLVGQMLQNLILNAADAMGSGGTVELGATVLSTLPGPCALLPSGEGPWVELQIRDEGSGIPGEVLPRIFEPFFTTKALSSRRGTGLGLSMVYEMARDLGIGLRVESVQGRGSCFHLLLPGASTARRTGAG